MLANILPLAHTMLVTFSDTETDDAVPRKLDMLTIMHLSVIPAKALCLSPVASLHVPVCP